jgi:hypothetical protein
MEAMSPVAMPRALSVWTRCPAWAGFVTRTRTSVPFTDTLRIGLIGEIDLRERNLFPHRQCKVERDID